MHQWRPTPPNDVQHSQGYGCLGELGYDTLQNSNTADRMAAYVLTQKEAALLRSLLPCRSMSGISAETPSMAGSNALMPHLHNLNRSMSSSQATTRSNASIQVNYQAREWFLHF